MNRSICVSYFLNLLFLFSFNIQLNGMEPSAQLKSFLEQEEFSWNQINSLIKQGADPDTRDENGYTLLHLAALLGESDQIEWLLNNGALKTVVNIKNETPLDIVQKFESVYPKNYEKVIALLTKDSMPKN
ncbi:MAG: ankyrin repeat domain-containing protein [Candidatus Babeliales bacterium]